MPHSAGVAPSIFMRLIAEKLSKLWGKQVLVENKPGASGFIAIESMKSAARDGHELLAVANSHMTINPSLYRRLPYDPEKDFVPVAMVLRASFFITVASNGPYPTVAALIAAATRVVSVRRCRLRTVRRARQGKAMPRTCDFWIRIGESVKPALAGRRSIHPITVSTNRK
jgi:tripartite-type tricarboxylate transporter receptor subunit TctC